MSSTAALVGSYIAFIMGIFGFFGNGCILVAVARIKKLQTKCGLLMALIALYDSIIIVFLYFQALVFILEIELTTRKCFNAVFLYIFVQHMHLATVFSVAVDRLCSIVFPVLYRTINAKNWLLYTMIPGLILNAIFLPWGYFVTNDEPVEGCDPPTALPDAAALWWSRLIMTINIVIVVIYISVYVAIHINSRKFSTSNHDTQAKNFFELQKKAMRTVSLIIVVLCSTVFVTQTICILFFDAPELTEHAWFLSVVDLASVPVMFQYSLNYYVYFWRSSEYREVFKEQLFAIFPFLRKLFDNKMLFVKKATVSQATTTGHN